MALFIRRLARIEHYIEELPEKQTYYLSNKTEGCVSLRKGAYGFSHDDIIRWWNPTTIVESYYRVLGVGQHKNDLHIWVQRLEDAGTKSAGYLSKEYVEKYVKLFRSGRYYNQAEQLDYID